jgi:hypothetical protein
MAKREQRLTDDEREEARSRSQSAHARNVELEAPVRDEREDEAVEDRELSDDERFALFQESFVQSVLPKPPQFEGYHSCWLTTSNSRDTIDNRRRLGYTLVPISAVHGWKGSSLKSGEYPGIVSVNEMLLGRIPLRLYNRYMKEVHETLPRSEEEKVKSTVDSLKENAAAENAHIRDEGDGTADLVQRARPMPVLTE